MISSKEKTTTLSPAKKSPVKKIAPKGETALHHRRTREQHAEERAQDYVEAIAGLIEAHGEARATDLAKLLGVTHVTVIRTVARLQREELVSTQPYRAIFLTDSGKKLAQQMKERHELVIRFLEALGVPSEVAQSDAEGIEHHVSIATLAAFEKYLKGKK